jgi:hypothetical protein
MNHRIRKNKERIIHIYAQTSRILLLLLLLLLVLTLTLSRLLSYFNSIDYVIQVFNLS